MYGIITKSKNFVSDNMLDPSGEPRKGLILFKKKTNALSEADELNRIAKQCKQPQLYSVQKVAVDDITSDGIIVDGVWKQKL